MATVDDVRRIAMALPRTTEHLIRDHTKFRVGRLVYASVSPDEERIGFGFTDAWRMVVPKTVAARYLDGQGIGATGRLS